MRSAQASAKVRASLRPAVAAEQPELLLCGSEDCRGACERLVTALMSYVQGQLAQFCLFLAPLPVLNS